jgi:nitrile hydratase
MLLWHRLFVYLGLEGKELAAGLDAVWGRSLFGDGAPAKQTGHIVHGGARQWTALLDTDLLRKMNDEFGAAIASLGYGGRSANHLVALENTPQVHNMVTCTLCSCYPWALLGLPPLWYKSAPYRSRSVSEPRAVLKDFGIELPKDTEIRVWDSTAELRYLVLPVRPAGTEGWSEDKLADLVTRDSMIGTGVAKRPEELQ